MWTSIALLLAASPNRLWVLRAGVKVEKESARRVDVPLDGAMKDE